MKPIQFEYANQQLGAPAGLLERCDRRSPLELHVKGIDPLPVWTDGEQCVSCWRMSVMERLAALLFGRVWLAVLSGSTQPAVCIQAGRTYLKEEQHAIELPDSVLNWSDRQVARFRARFEALYSGRSAAVKHPPEAV